MSLMLMRGEILFLKRFYFSKQSASSNISRIFSLGFRIFLFLKVIFGVLGLRCGERAVSRDGGRGLFSGGARGGGGSCCGAWALGAPALAFVARRLSSCDPRVGRWIPNHRPAREVPGVHLWEGWLAFSGGLGRLSLCPTVSVGVPWPVPSCK